MPKSKHTRKNKRRDRSGPAPRKHDLAGGRLELRTYQISDDIKNTYRPGITEAIAQATRQFKQGHIVEAKAAFESIIEREPRAKEAYMNLAVAYSSLGDEATAEALTRQTMEKFPNYPMARLNLARIYLHRGQLAEVKQLLESLDHTRRFTSIEFQTYARAWSDIHTAEGNFEAAQTWMDMLREVRAKFEAE